MIWLLANVFKGIATPADAALMMQIGVDGVFVGSGIFKSGNPVKRANAIVQAVLHYNNPTVLAQVSEDLGEAMVGINVHSEQWATREAVVNTQDVGQSK